MIPTKDKRVIRDSHISCFTLRKLRKKIKLKKMI